VLLLVVGGLLAPAIAGAVALTVWHDGSRRSLPAAGPPPATAAPSTTTAPGAPAGGEAPSRDRELIANPGFEASTAGWSPAGEAVLERVRTAKAGRWSVKIVAGGPPRLAPGIAYTAVPVPDGEVGQEWEATVWARASRPDTTVQVNLVEYVDGGRFAVDSAGTVLRGTSWHRIEVEHYLHRDRSRLAVEVVLPGLPGGSAVLVDAAGMRPREGGS